MIKKVRFRASRWCFHITRVNIFFNVIVIFVIFSRFCHCCLVTKTIITVGRIHIINPFHFSLIKQVVIEIGLNGEVLTLRFDLIEGWWKIMTWSFSYHFFHFGDLFNFGDQKWPPKKRPFWRVFSEIRNFWSISEMKIHFGALFRVRVGREKKKSPKFSRFGAKFRNVREWS